jgi:hypothetical protein
MSPGSSTSGPRDHITPTTRAGHTPTLAQTKLDSQGRIRQKTPTNQTEGKQSEREKETDPPVEKRPHTSRPTTRGTATELEALAREEIRDLAGQEIKDSEGGKLYLERTLLTIPGAPWTTEALTTAILQVTQYKGMTRQTTNALRSIAFVLEQLGDDIRGDRIADKIKAQLAIEGDALTAGMKEAAALVDKATAVAELAARTSQRVTEAAEVALISIQNASTTVTTSATQLSETTTTYSDAVKRAAAHTQPTPVAITAIPALDVRVRAREGVKQRQILVDAADAGAQILGELDNAGLAKKANEALHTIDADTTHTIISARRLNNGGVLYEFDSEGATTWINEVQHRIQFTAALAPGARIKTRLFPLVLQFIPLHFGPDRNNELRNIEGTNRLPHGAIDKAKWLKPMYRRSPNQTCGHALITFNSPDIANKVLTNSLIICQKRVYAEKCKKEPTCCLKCQGWGHLSYACPQSYDTCGTCGDRHKTSACTNRNKTRCASCNIDIHTSWDRVCPSFLRRCEEMDGRLPENLMPYFPTAEPWTHVSQPPRIAPPTLMLPTPTDPRTTGGWTTVPHRNSIHRQTTLPFKPTTQGQLTTGQGPPASQRQVSPATHPNRIGLGPTTRWGETEDNTGQSQPVHN